MILHYLNHGRTISGDELEQTDRINTNWLVLYYCTFDFESTLVDLVNLLAKTSGKIHCLKKVSAL